MQILSLKKIPVYVMYYTNQVDALWYLNITCMYQRAPYHIKKNYMLYLTSSDSSSIVQSSWLPFDFNGDK